MTTIETVLANAEWDGTRYPTCPTCDTTIPWGVGCDECHPLHIRLDAADVVKTGGVPLWWADVINFLDFPTAAAMVQIYRHDALDHADPWSSTPPEQRLLSSSEILSHLDITDRRQILTSLTMMADYGLIAITYDEPARATAVDDYPVDQMGHSPDCACMQVLVTFQAKQDAVALPYDLFGEGSAR